MRRLLRNFGMLLVIGGFLCLGWAVVVWRWEDPFTGVYTEYQQGKLERRYRSLESAYRGSTPGVATFAAHARALRSAAGRGQPIGRLRVPAIGVDMLVINGTDPDSLKRGPGRYAGARVDLGAYVGIPPAAYMPGEGELVYVAGHRTTYAAPFADIDDIERGDRVTLDVPYASFEYVVTGTRIVAANEISVLRSGGAEQLALQACHPRFSGSRRYIVYARMASVTAARPGKDA